MQLLVLAAVWSYPKLATGLPYYLFRTTAQQQNGAPPPPAFDINQPETDGG
jgi:hypothetical protein